jgi:hypothetical protein
MPDLYDSRVKAKVLNFPGLVTEQYDSVELGYTDSKLATVTFKLAGATVATLTLSYDGSNKLTGVAKT